MMMKQPRSLTNCTLVRRHHKFSSGGAKPDMERKYKGACCDGDKVHGDGNTSQCIYCPYKAYLCGMCRKELPPPPVEPASTALIPVGQAEGSCSVVARSSAAVAPSEPPPAAAGRRAPGKRTRDTWELLDTPEAEAMMESIERRVGRNVPGRRSLWPPVRPA
jgi:hypothetical protein